LVKDASKYILILRKLNILKYELKFIIIKEIKEFIENKYLKSFFDKYIKA